MTPEPNPYPLFDGSQWSPSGQNYYYWNNSEANYWDRNVTQTFNQAKRNNAIEQWQEIAYDELPSITIAYSQETVALAKGVNGTPFSIYYFPLWCPAEQWMYLNATLSGDKMVLAQVGPVGPPKGESLSPAHTTTYYDFTGIGSIFGELGGGGFMIRNTSWFTVPYLLTSGTSSADHLFYNVTMRHDITFQDGESCDARDLVATLRACLSPLWGASIYYLYVSILGSDSKTNPKFGFGNYSVWYAGEPGTRGENWTYDPYTLGFALPAVPSVNYSGLTAPWFYFDIDILGTALYPGHVLTNTSSNMWTTQSFIRPDAATLAHWSSTSFADGVSGRYRYYFKNGTATTYNGPFSIGPYKFVSLDSVSGIFKLTRWDGYFRASALKAEGLMQIKDFWVQQIANPSEAIAALHAGNVQVLDANYHVEQTLYSLDPTWSGYVQHPGWGVQELGFNMQHPIFGTGTGTPLGQAYPSRAAEAAKHVRHAVEYLVPKDYIIKNLLKGGYLGLTTAVLPQMPGYASGITIRNATQADATYNAIQEFKAAGYNFVPVIPSSFWNTYGLLLSVVQLAIVVVLAGLLVHIRRQPPRKL
jgi:ABC-type transport system substrate-binding protein